MIKKRLDKKRDWVYNLGDGRNGCHLKKGLSYAIPILYQTASANKPTK